MSAHWYWDWEWGGKGGGLQRPGAPAAPPAAMHNPDPTIDVPEEIKAPRGPCQKIARYIGLQDPGPNAKPPDFPPNLTWHPFALEELDSSDNHYPGSPPTEYYWVACDTGGKDCCPGKNRCKFYETRVLLPKLNVGDPKRYIRDFKCKCFNK